MATGHGKGQHVYNLFQGWPRRRLWLGTGLLLLAAALRLWALSLVPPGLHHDEAFHLLSARAIVDGAGVPVYITGNQGNEPMQAYLSAGVVRWLNDAPWAGRLLAAWVGVASVALTLRLGRAMFPRRTVGLWAGLVLACLYWHLTMSRWGSQPILSAAAAAGAMLGLWHGARTGSRGAFVLAGASLAFGLWSYVAFRLFPLVPLVSGLALLGAQRGQFRRVFKGGLLAAGVATALYAPLGLYFIAHPEWFFNRYSQITALQPGAASVAEQLLDHAGRVAAGLVWPGAGDENWRQNLPGRPGLDPVQAVAAGLGLALALRQWRRPTALALGAWLVVGLAPAVLTEFPPQFGRTVMVTPALALLAGLGAAAMWESRRVWLRAGLALALAASGWLTLRDYFGRWANDEHLFVAFDAGLAQLAIELRAAGPGVALYESPVYRDYPTFEYMLGPQAYRRFRAFNGRACTVLPKTTTAPTVFGVIVADDERTLPALQAAYPGGALRLYDDPAGRPYAALYEIPAGNRARLGAAVSGPVGATMPDAQFGRLVRLRDYRLEATALQGGDSLEMTLAWELARTTPAQLTTYTHVIGPPQADGAIVYAQNDRQPCDNAYPTWQWKPGEVVLEYVSVQLPNPLPPGLYDITVGWYDSLTQQRLALTAGEPDRSGSFKLGTLLVEAR